MIILFHLNIATALISYKIVFDKRGGMKFTESAHVKDVLAFFRVIINCYDNISLTRILLMLEKVGPKTVSKILETVLVQDDPLKALRSYQTRPVGLTTCTLWLIPCLSSVLPASA